MKNTLISTLLILTICLSVVILQRLSGPIHKPNQSNAITSSLASKAEEKARPLQEKKSAPKPRSKKEVLAMPGVRQALDKLEAGMAKEQETTTPEIRAEIRQAHIEKYKYDYNKFFKSLKLSDIEINQALDIIIDRENKFLDARENMYKVGFIAGGKEFAETRKLERLLADVQLQNLLGDKSHQMLAKFEKDYNNNLISEANRIVSKHQDD